MQIINEYELEQFYTELNEINLDIKNTSPASDTFYELKRLKKELEDAIFVFESKKEK